MPVNQIVNPAESTESNLSGLFTAPFFATGAITKGEAVQLVTAVTGTVSFKVKAAVITANFLVIGIATKSVTSGTLVTVTTYGPALALIKTNVVKGDLVLQTGVNAGRVKTVVPPSVVTDIGKVIGVALQTKTTAVTALVWIYVEHA